MRTYLSLLLLLLFTGVQSIFGQTDSTYFENVWHGYNTGDYNTGRFPFAIKTADLDNDGDVDAVASQGNFETGFVLLLNNGNGIYSLPIYYPSPLASYDVAIADFNADGLKDVVVSNKGFNNEGNSISIFINSGSAVFALPVNVTVGAAPVGLATADLDGDGDLDIATCNRQDATISIVKNNGGGTFSASASFPAGNAPYKLVASQMDADNQVDLIVANESTQKLNVLYNTGSATFLTKVEYSVMSIVWGGDMWSCVEAADLDNDGDNDILYSSTKTFEGNSGYIAYFKNNGNGTLAPLTSLPFTLNSGGSTDIEVADLNGDGWKDIVGNYYSGRETDNYQLLMNNGSGGFLPALSRPAGNGTYSLSTADVNSDGLIDILTLDLNSMQLTVHKNQGNGIFPLPVTFSTSNGLAGALDAADIDDDGDLDIMSSASSIGPGVTVTVAKNSGNGSFLPAVAYSIGDGGVRAKFRDLNGDGKEDIVFATAVSSPPYNFHTAINNGDGTFGARQTWPMGSCGWSDIDAIDMDNDGDLDAVVTEWGGCPSVPLSARRIFISNNNGNGTFSSPLIKIINPTPSCLASGDFNRDGNIDLVTGHSLSLAVHLGTGTGDIQPAVTYVTEQSPYDVIVNDFNNDGRLDIATCTEYNYEGMSVLLGNGDGTFQPAQNYFGAYVSDLRNESGITSGDIDTDGDVDIMVSNSGSNDLSIYLNDGSGHFIFRSRVGVYYNAAAPIFAEFTGDCKLDLLAAVQIPFHLFDGAAVTVLRGTSACPVPVNFLQLKALVHYGNIQVTWHVTEEVNIAKYEIEKSKDGRNFMKVGEVGSRNSSVLTSYLFVDIHPNNGSNFYRIRIVNPDGTSKYSEVVFITLKKSGLIQMTVAPNPSHSISTASIWGNLKGPATIDLHDVHGSIVARIYSGILNTNVFSTTLNLGQFNRGVYFLKLTMNNSVITERILVQ